MKLTITGIGEAKKIAKDFDYIVSVIGEGTPLKFGVSNERHFISYFDDISIEGCDPEDYDIPEQYHIDDILEFTRRFEEDDKVLIHCSAGMSRSTAVAAVVLAQHGMTPVEAMAHVYEVREACWPNSKIIGFGDSALSLNGELIKAVSDWKKIQNPHHVDMNHVGQTVTREDADEMERLRKLFE